MSVEMNHNAGVTRIFFHRHSTDGAGHTRLQHTQLPPQVVNDASDGRGVDVQLLHVLVLQSFRHRLPGASCIAPGSSCSGRHCKTPGTTLVWRDGAVGCCARTLARADTAVSMSTGCPSYTHLCLGQLEEEDAAAGVGVEVCPSVQGHRTHQATSRSRLSS